MTDEEGIRRTLATYCQCCDDGRFGEFAELFTSEAVFTVMGGEHVGRAAIRAFMEAAQPPEQRGKHITTNSIIAVEGHEARVATDYIFVTRNEDRFAITSVGRYVDELVRDGDTWRFARREIIFM